MNVQTFYPQNPVLKKYVEYYYFLKTTSHDFTSIYYAFPNTLQAFNIHRHSRCEINSLSTIVHGDKKNKYLMIVQGKHELPLFVQLRGVLDKVTVIFKPLGLNHFIKSPLIKIAGKASQVFTEWCDDENYEGFLSLFYSTDDNKKRIHLLEEYLLCRYTPFGEEAILQQALNLLTDFNVEYSIEKIAQSLSMSTRSFNRLFCKHIGTSPVKYRKIARFRHSLKNKLFNDRFKTLTEIGYESNFYDQSYFNKMYKKITGDSPSRFFNSIEKLADDQLIFKFVNK